jgi:hypothetical protein
LDIVAVEQIDFFEFVELVGDLDQGSAGYFVALALVM